MEIPHVFDFLHQDDDENLARNVAMRTRTLLEVPLPATNFHRWSDTAIHQVAENVWPIVHNQNLTSLEKFEERKSKIHPKKS